MLLRRQSAVALVLAMSLSCSADRDEPKSTLSEFERTLSAVSHELLFWRFDIEVGRNQYCPIDAESWDEAASPHSGPLDQFFAETRALCDLYNKLSELSEPVFRDVVSSGRVSGRLHSFSFFTKDLSDLDDPVFREKKAGPFPNAESCEAMEQHLRGARIGTRKCMEWEPYGSAAEPE